MFFDFQQIKNFSLRILQYTLPLVVLFFACKLMVQGVGYYIDSRDSLLFLLVIILASSSKKFFWLIFFPLILCYILYMPFGFVFGPPTFRYLISVYSSDLSESKEFLQQIPIKYFFYALFSLFGVLFFKLYTQRYSIEFYKNKTLVILLCVFSLANQLPFSFPRKLVRDIKMVYRETKRLKEIQQEPLWNISGVNSKYQNYVLIIGESARRDYHHTYGYPIENTPFMDKTNGIVVDGLTAGGRNTVESLRLMLTLTDTKKWDANYAYNFIGLANKAQINTFWISNQGYLGTFDTPISAIANNSLYTDFLKKGDSFDENTSDFSLIPIFQERLYQQVNKVKPNLYVLHLYGSHPYACERVKDYKKKIRWALVQSLEIGCYVTSIRKTDEFLERIYNILNKNYQNDNKQTFSMVYFSDHGLATDSRNPRNINLSQYTLSKYHYDIPLIKISSDDTTRQEFKSFKSGLNFTKGIAHWLGIKTSQIKEEYNLFDGVNDVDDYGLSEILKAAPLDDKPIVTE